MMTLSDFIVKYFRKKVDYDKAWGAQCVDLVRQYFKDVWDLPMQPEGVVGAKDFFTLHDKRLVQKEMLTRIDASNGTVPPPPGAVVVFGDTGTNPYGHIAICTAANEEAVVTFEQDGFAQDGAKFGLWDYKRLLGWFIKKES